MSVMDLLRGVPSPTSGGGSADDGRTPWHRHLLAGAGTALASSLVVVLPALVSWVASPKSTVPWTDALGVGASLWLLAGGSWLRAGTASIAFVPLLLFAGVVLAAVWGARHSAAEAVDDRPATSYRWGLLPRRVVNALGLWAAGYAVCAALWAAVAAAAAPRPQALGLVLPLFVVPAVAVVVAATRLVKADPRLGGPRWRRPDVVPDFVRRAVRPAATGAAAMLAVGMAVTVLLVVLRFPQVAHLHRSLAPGIVGGVVMTLAQVLCLPNVGLWAVSFLAGTGFSVVDGASTTWTGSRSGLMPMVPALGALPDPGAFPGWLPALALLPVGVGALIGWRSLRSVALLSTTRTKLLVTGSAVTLAAALLGALDALAGGSLGGSRLSAMGAPAGPMALALLAEFGLGAALVLVWDRWRLRR